MHRAVHFQGSKVLLAGPSLASVWLQALPVLPLMTAAAHLPAFPPASPPTRHPPSPPTDQTGEGPAVALKEGARHQRGGQGHRGGRGAGGRGQLGPPALQHHSTTASDRGGEGSRPKSTSARFTTRGLARWGRWLISPETAQELKTTANDSSRVEPPGTCGSRASTRSMPSPSSARVKAGSVSTFYIWVVRPLTLR